MRRSMGLLAGFCGVVLAAAPAAAQQDPAGAAAGAPAQDPDIVVEGRKAPPKRSDVFEQAQGLSRASRSYDENLARFQVPLCPGVSGFKAEPASLIVDRIRANAARVGVPLAKGRCSPNLIVVVTDDGRALLADLDRDRPHMLELIDASERSELLNDRGPTRVWSNILTLNYDTGGIVERVDGREMLPSVWGHTSRWFVPFERDILSALVVLDRAAVLGMSLTQLADYATMRGLTHTRDASGDEPMPTILSLFAHGGGGVPELTSFDLGYLRSLYSERPDVPAVTRLLSVRWYAARARKEAEKVQAAAVVAGGDASPAPRE